MLQKDKTLHFPATLRNRAAITKVLKHYLPRSGTILEIGSGSGEHIIFFGKQFPHLKWQPSDIDVRNTESIDAWIDTEMGNAKNVLRPLIIDISNLIPRVENTYTIICINVVHISPWKVTEGLMRNAGTLLPNGGILYLYGPYKIDGKHTAQSNKLFDTSLKLQNKSWGVRNLEDICDEATNNDLVFIERVEMPSNNQSLIFKKSSARGVKRG